MPTVVSEQINAAVAAHGMWKARLRTAIDKGSSEFEPALVSRDDQCAFGKWLCGPNATELKKAPMYARCLDLHRRFHAAAGRVLNMAVSGRKKDASDAMASGSDYAKISAELTRVLLEWKSQA